MPVFATMPLMAAMLTATTPTAMPVPPAPAASVYRVALTLTDGGRIVGRPVLTVRAGARGRVGIGDTAGHRYDVSLTATPQRVGTVVGLAMRVAYPSADGAARIAAFALLVAPGTPVTLILDAMAATRPLRIDIDVAPAADRPQAAPPPG